VGSRYDFDPAEGTRNVIEAGSQNDNIEMVLIAVTHFNTCLGKGVDGILLKRDDIDIDLITNLVIVLFERGSLRSECMGLVFEERGKNVSLTRCQDVELTLLNFRKEQSQ